MTTLHDRCRQQLEAAVKVAALALLDHMQGAAGFSIELQPGLLWVTAGKPPGASVPVVCRKCGSTDTMPWPQSPEKS